MDRLGLIKFLCHVTQEVANMDQKYINKAIEDNKIKFRSYDRIDANRDEVKMLNLTIEF